MREIGASCCSHCQDSREAITVLQQQVEDLRAAVAEAYRKADSAESWHRPIGGPM